MSRPDDAMAYWRSLEERVRSLMAATGAREVSIQFKASAGRHKCEGWHCRIGTTGRSPFASGLHPTPEAAIEADIAMLNEMGAKP